VAQKGNQQQPHFCLRWQKEFNPFAMQVKPDACFDQAK